MKLLITGGAGFIGSNFIYYTLKTHPEDEIICLDALTYAGSIDTLLPAGGYPNFTFIRGDIADRELIDGLFARERFDAVVNFAAETHVDRSIRTPDIFIRTNVSGTQVLLDACLKYEVKRFHQISTDEVYGDLPLDRPDLHFTEETPLRPSSPYSASKAAADLLVQAYRRTYGLDVTISRCSNIYGPYQFPVYLFPLMIFSARADRPLPVYGAGKNIRDWLHVKDHCAAVDLILRNGRSGALYNIGGHNEYANIDIVRMILSAMRKPESLISFVADRAGHDLRYAIDPSKITAELHWQPQKSFRDGLQDVIAWYAENEAWWQPLLKRAELT